MNLEASSFTAFLPWLILPALLLSPLDRTWMPRALVLTGAAYLAYSDPASAAALAFVTLTVLFAVCWHPGARTRTAAIALIVGGFVAYRAAGAASAQGVVLLGLAFYTMRALQLLFDDAAGRLSLRPEPSAVVGWLWFLPTLLTGPINRFDEFERELARRRWDPQLVAEGLERLLVGAFKIVVLAGWLVSWKLRLYVETLDEASRAFHLLATLQYALNLYLMFAGFSDLAIGGARLLGIRIQENFDHPWRAASITEFWRRWHISLSEWCRRHVHMPVFAATRRAAPAAICAMLVLGLWHEFSLRYLAWALWHGIGIACWQRWNRSDLARRLEGGPLRLPWLLCSILLTQTFVVAGFVFTSCDSFHDALLRWSVILGW